MSQDPFYEDPFFEDIFPWKDCSPEEYMAKHGLGLGAFSKKHMTFKDKEMEGWARRLEEVFNDPKEIEAAKRKFLTPEELERRGKQFQKILKHGL